MRHIALLSAIAMAMLFTLSSALPRGVQEKKPTFDPAANATELIANATHLATKKNRRVLIVWGSEANAADLSLNTALRRGKTKDWPFYYEYVITQISQGENAELAKSLGAPASTGEAALSILDADGMSLAHHSASEFRSGEGWDNSKLGAVLTKHIVVPEDAEVVMKDALANATKTNRRLFVHLGAPW